jgi:wyosine [tRNA(Phe)-imidazoG37] synthetase (radical SAM superfamily)
MADTSLRIAFGPVPSRRLGRSLGINNIPAKICTYSCIYCQVGPTTEKCIEPRHFASPRQIRDAIEAHLARLQGPDRAVDYLTFVPDGEPTLDLALGDSIAALRGLGIPIAVITNGTLLWREDVRARLGQADLVSVKVDGADEATWRRINRPHRNLELDMVLRGIRDFAAGYAGTLIAETMLLAGLNDSSGSLIAVADLLAEIGPRTAYLAVPTRPTLVEGIRGTDAAGLIRAHELFAARLPEVELITGHEIGEFAHTGDARKDLLAITAVHPMREAAVRRLLADNNAEWTVVGELLDAGLVKIVEYAGDRFYLRTMPE